MVPRVRALTGADRDEALEFLARSPVENLFLAAKVATYGIDRRRLGNVFAFERGGEVVSMMLDGGTVFVGDQLRDRDVRLVTNRSHHRDLARGPFRDHLDRRMSECPTHQSVAESPKPC